MIRSRCTEQELRARMSDAEFWEHVLQGGVAQDGDDDGWDELSDTDYDDQVDYQMNPCPICGVRGACGYDAMGEPMIHSIQYFREA